MSDLMDWAASSIVQELIMLEAILSGLGMLVAIVLIFGGFAYAASKDQERRGYKHNKEDES